MFSIPYLLYLHDLMLVFPRTPFMTRSFGDKHQFSCLLLASGIHKMIKGLLASFYYHFIIEAASVKQVHDRFLQLRREYLEQNQPHNPSGGF